MSANTKTNPWDVRGQKLDSEAISGRNEALETPLF